MLRESPIGGDVYTQATNIEDETNGLIEPASGTLLAPDGLLRTGTGDVVARHIMSRAYGRPDPAG